MRTKPYYYYTVISFVLSFVVIFAGTLFLYDETRYYDSSYYWNTGLSVFCADGSISFQNYPQTFRGYLLPFLLGFIQQKGLFSNGHVIFVIVNSLALAFTVSVIIPEILNVREKNNRKFVFGSTVFSFILVLFHNTHMINSLSDFPAFFFFVLFIYIMVKVLDIDISNAVWKVVVLAAILGCIAGVAFYAAYNIRVIHIYPSVAVLAVSIYRFIKKFISSSRKKVEILCASVFLVSALGGAYLVASPQMEINEQYYGEASPKVHTEQMQGTISLELVQVAWGTSVDNYITYVGDTQVTDQPSVAFYDRSGLKLLSEIDNKVTISSYISLWLKYPGEMISLYVKHIISLATPIFSDNCYVRDLNADKFILFFINLFIWFIFGMTVLNNTGKTFLEWIKTSGLIILITALPGLVMILGGPEVRFFISVYFILYGTVCYKTDFKAIYAQIKKAPVKLSILYFAVVIVWLCLINTILEGGSIVDGSTLSFSGLKYVPSSFSFFEFILLLLLPYFVILITIMVKKIISRIKTPDLVENEKTEE